MILSKTKQINNLIEGKILNEVIFLIYAKYKNARDSAWQCLIDYNITSLPVKVLGIAKTLGIKVIKDSTAHKLASKESGKSYLLNDQWQIVYNDAESKQRCRFTVAHELGHIVLGHKLNNSGVYTRTFELKKEEETEADIFASRLLAPACVLWALDVHTPEKIAQLCDISHEASEIRADRMEVLYKRNRFLLSPLERQVYRNFEKFINEQKNLAE